MALKNIASKGVSNETLTVKTIQRNTYFVCFSQMTRKPSDKIFKKKINLSDQNTTNQIKSVC